MAVLLTGSGHMKTNTPSAPKTNYPGSDESARAKHPDAAQDPVEDASPDISGLQTPNKSGKHSTVEKLAASRPEFGTGRRAEEVAGGFGDDPYHPVTGRNAGPQTNQFRCSGCGRYFNTRPELAAHETECRTAKAATRSGIESLEREDATPHAPNHAESKDHAFQHGTRQPS